MCVFLCLKKNYLTKEVKKKDKGVSSRANKCDFFTSFLGKLLLIFGDFLQSD